MIFIFPMGDVNLNYIEKAKNYVEKVYGGVRIMESLPFPEKCFNEKRRQYHAVYLLESLPEMEEGKVVGICDRDIYVEGLNFVFGVAQSIGGKKCVVSIKRLRESFYGKEEDEDLLVLRIAKEIVHEVGHLKGLEHCENPRCVMHFSNSIYDTDFKDYKFCEKCKRRIIK